MDMMRGNRYTPKECLIEAGCHDFLDSRKRAEEIYRWFPNVFSRDPRFEENTVSFNSSSESFMATSCRRSLSKPGYVKRTREPVKRQSKRMRRKERRREPEIVKKMSPSSKRMRGKEGRKRTMKKASPLGAHIL
eukprot:12429021-Karenia_brevis.AAC.1